MISCSHDDYFILTATASNRCLLNRIRVGYQRVRNSRRAVRPVLELYFRVVNPSQMLMYAARSGRILNFLLVVDGDWCIGMSAKWIIDVLSWHRRRARSHSCRVALWRPFVFLDCTNITQRGRRSETRTLLSVQFCEWSKLMMFTWDRSWYHIKTHIHHLSMMHWPTPT